MTYRIKVDFHPDFPRLSSEGRRAYAAGFFDGEGCVCIFKQPKVESRRGYVYRLVATLSQNHLSSLCDFQNLIGVEGRIYRLPRSGTANRDTYTLNYDGRAAADLLTALQPYLHRKKDEAEVALEFQNQTHLNRHFGPGGCPSEVWNHRTALYKKLRKLK